MLHVNGLLSRVLLIVAIAGGISPKPIEAAGMEPSGLKDCPGSPNCVFSEAADPEQRVDPFRLKGDSAKIWPAVLRVVAAMPRTAVITHTDHYIQAECKSRIFRFVDELELFLKPESGTVSVRSASQSGYYDFGVNRHRVEYLRQALLAAGLIEH